MTRSVRSPGGALHSVTDVLFPTVGVIICAAGSGLRLGADRPKAFVDLAGRTILEHCVDGVLAAGLSPSQIVVAVPADQVEHARRLVGDVTVVPGGAHRSDSVRAGLAACDTVREVIAVHDAARPLTPPEAFAAVLTGVADGHPAVVPGIPVADTLKRVGPPGVDGAQPVEATVDRDSLRAIQTPQAFTREALAAAHVDDTGVATDDAGLAERRGIDVHVVPGSARAFKITTRWDLAVAEHLLAAGAEVTA